MVWAREPLEGRWAAAEERLGFVVLPGPKDSFCPGLPLPGAGGNPAVGHPSLDFM